LRRNREEFAKKDLQNAGIENMPGRLDQEVPVYETDMLIVFKGAIVCNPIGRFTEFTGREAFGFDPGKEAGLMDICHCAAACTGLIEGFLIIEADATVHGCMVSICPCNQICLHKVEAYMNVYTRHIRR
jgi:hypothetical protein